MFRNILLAVDGSALSLRAAEHGLKLAGALNARVTAMMVTTPWAVQFAREPAVLVPAAVVPEGEYERRMRAVAGDTLRSIADAAKQAGIACEAHHVPHRDPYLAIIDTARLAGCDLIVMGAHGRRGLAGILLGSETVKVLTHCSIPVLVYRETGSAVSAELTGAADKDLGGRVASS
jgi:nucleotide-binding universal stress UspA family protein